MVDEVKIQLLDACQSALSHLRNMHDGRNVDVIEQLATAIDSAEGVIDEDDPLDDLENEMFGD
jgi:hypothetical protein